MITINSLSKLLIALVMSLACLSFNTSDVQGQANFNVNYVANQYLKSGKMYDCSSANKYCLYNTKIINTGRKDVEGNEIIHLTLTKGPNTKSNISFKRENDSFIMVPEFEPYPIRYYLMLNGKPGISYYDQGTRNKVNYYSHTAYFLPDIKKTSFVSRIGFGSQGKGIADYFFQSGPRIADKSAAWVYKNYVPSNEDFKKALIKQWEVAETVLKQELVKAKSINYDEKILTLDGKKVYLSERVLGKVGKIIGMTECKISVQKNSAGKVTSLTLHFPFRDGKYYDKPKFFIKITKNNKGFFEMKKEGEMNLNPGIIIPFMDMFLVCNNNEKSGYAVNTVISSHKASGMAHNLLRYNKIIPYYNTSLDSDIFYHKSIEEHYVEWWKQENLENSYNFRKDIRHMGSYLKDYIKNLKI